jgi:hypothetical protein
MPYVTDLAGFLEDERERRRGRFGTYGTDSAGWRDFLLVEQPAAGDGPVKAGRVGDVMREMPGRVRPEAAAGRPVMPAICARPAGCAWVGGAAG